MQYQVTGRYKSDVGHYQGGEIIELTDAEAAWFERDVPGLMVPYVVPAEAETTLPDAPPMDRMMKAAPKKRGKGGDDGGS